MNHHHHHSDAGYRAIPEVDEELEHGGVWVVPVQDADEGTPVQEL